jgi:hypothetical protein
MQYVILSLGQLVEPKLNLSLNAFAKLLKDQGRWFAYARTYAAYLLDLKYYHNIEKFNKGMLDKHVFYEKICWQLGIKNCDENSVKKSFWDSWEKMCELDDNALHLLRKLNSLLSSITNIGRELPRFIIISNTNFIHHDYIIDKFIQNKAHQALIGNAIWKLSYEAGTILHKDLLKKVFERLELRKDDVIISCHNRIDESLMPEGVKINFIKTTFTVSELNKALNDSHTSIRR